MKHFMKKLERLTDAVTRNRWSDFMRFMDDLERIEKPSVYWLCSNDPEAIELVESWDKQYIRDGVPRFSPHTLVSFYEMHCGKENFPHAQWNMYVQFVTDFFFARVFPDG